MTHEVKEQELEGLPETVLLAYLLSCHKDQNFLGRTLVRAKLMRQGVEVPAVFFDVVCNDAITGKAGYYYPNWRKWFPGGQNCPYCNGVHVGSQEKNDVDDGNVRFSRQICFSCGTHGAFELC